MKEISVKIGIVFLIGIILFSTNHHKNKARVIKGKDRLEVAEEAVNVAVTMDGNINYINLDEYLLGVVAGEMPANFELEALKAQVVASRTFVYNRQLSVDNTTNSQVYLTEAQMKKNWGNQYDENRKKIMMAIKETDNNVMKYHGDYITALFFSSSNGYTENVEDYFASDPLPYLKSVDCHWDLTIDPKNKRQKIFSRKQLKAKFNCNDLDFNVIAHKKSGRVATLNVGGKNYSGRQVREILGLASSCFSIEVNGDNFCFTTLGSGHGVGMSQYGAQGMALEGATYQQILNHFYPGVKITNK